MIWGAIVLIVVCPLPLFAVPADVDVVVAANAVPIDRLYPIIALELPVCCNLGAGTAFDDGRH